MCEPTKRWFRINLSRFRHWVWWVFLAAVILLGVALWVEHPLFERMAFLALVIFTLVYARSTEKLADEAKEQRLDSSRPLLVPVGGTQGIVYLRPGILGQQIDARALHVHNIGVGPAENIAIRLELRSGSGSPTVQLDEMQNCVEPLPAGRMGVVRQWKSSEKPVEIYDDHWIVISYDDLFGRHFETEGRRIKDADIWVSIKTVPVKKRRPRVREVDYYAEAFGRDKVHK